MKLLALAAVLIARTEIAPGVVLIPGQLAPDRSPEGTAFSSADPRDGW